MERDEGGGGGLEGRPLGGGGGEGAKTGETGEEACGKERSLHFILNPQPIRAPCPEQEVESRMTSFNHKTNPDSQTSLLFTVPEKYLARPCE